MYKVKIINKAKVGNPDIVKRTHVLVFENDVSKSKFINGLKEEYDVTEVDENDFSYFDPRENIRLYASVEPCNSDKVPKLSKHQVWSRLYSNKNNCLESMITEFEDAEAVKDFVIKHQLNDKYQIVKDEKQGLKLYVSDLGLVMYAVNGSI